MLHYGKLISGYDLVTDILSMVFMFIGYFLFLKIAKRLKEKIIHGLTNIAWSSYILFIQGVNKGSSPGLYVTIISFITAVLSIYCLVDGIIRFILSLISVIKVSSATGEKTVESIDTAVAIATSLIAIVISIIEII